MFERSTSGVAMQPSGSHSARLFVMLLAYKTGMIRATQGFKLGVIAATGGVAASLYCGDGSWRFLPHTGPGNQRQWSRGESVLVSLWSSLRR